MGDKPNKQEPPIFAPKIPVKRRTASSTPVRDADTVQTSRGRGRGGASRGRGRGRVEHEQTASGIFALGPAERGAAISNINRTGSSQVIKSNDVEMVFDTPEEEFEDEELVQVQNDWAPGVIQTRKQRQDIKRISQKRDTNKIKTEETIKVKLEMDESYVDPIIADDSVETIESLENQFDNLDFTNPVNNGKLMFIQFPLALPMHIETDDQPQSAIRSNMTSLQSQLTNATDGYENPSPLPGGKMGKLIVRKSGKMTIKLGNHEYLLTESPSSTTAQYVTVVQKEDDIATAVFLDECLDRFICTP
ncbi:hypothetical protein HDV02_006603, partial [Globomyces sp. JEL0801]